MNLDDYPLPLPPEDYWMVEVRDMPARLWRVVLWPDPYVSATHFGLPTIIPDLTRIDATVLAKQFRDRIRPIRRLLGRDTRNMDGVRL